MKLLLTEAKNSAHWTQYQKRVGPHLSVYRFAVNSPEQLDKDLWDEDQQT